MSTIKQTYVIAATPEEVWHALTDPDMIREWSGEPAEYVPQVGAPYALWTGSIVGEILDVVPGERLVKTWRPVDWTRQDSVVRVTLVPEEGTTLVDLVHENVEEADYNGTSEGWDVYYLGAIKRMLEARNAGQGESTRKPAQPRETTPRASTRTAAAGRASTRKSAKGPKPKSAGKSTRRNSTTAKRATAKKRPAAKKSTARPSARGKRSR